MAAENDAMTQTQGAATNDADETETVCLPVTSVNTMVRGCIESGGVVGRREVQVLARAARGRYSDELVTVDARSAKWAYHMVRRTGETADAKRVFRRALTRLDSVPVVRAKGENDRLIQDPPRGRTAYKQRSDAVYRNLSRE